MAGYPRGDTFLPSSTFIGNLAKSRNDTQYSRRENVKRIAGLRRAAWRLLPRLCIYGLAGRALFPLPPPGFIARQQGKHTKDATAVPDADVEAGKVVL